MEERDKEMKPPEKKYCILPNTSHKNNLIHAENLGRNKAIDDMHKWIDECPIEKIIYDSYSHSVDDRAKVLRKMLKGEI